MNPTPQLIAAVVLCSLTSVAGTPPEDFHCRTVTRAPVLEVRSVEFHVPALQGAERSAGNGACVQRTSSVTFLIVTAAESMPGYERFKEKDGVERQALQSANGSVKRVDVRTLRFLGEKAQRYRFRGAGVELMADARDSELWTTAVRIRGHVVIARATYPQAEAEQWVSRLDGAIEAAKITLHADLGKPPGPKYMPSMAEAATRFVAALNAGDVAGVMKTLSEPSPGLVREDCIARRDFFRGLADAKPDGGSTDTLGLWASAQELAPEFEMLDCDRITETNAALVRFVAAKGGGVRVGQLEPQRQLQVFEVIPPGAPETVADQLTVAGPASDKLVIASGNIRGFASPFIPATRPPPAANLWMAFPQLRRWAIAKGFAPPR